MCGWVSVYVSICVCVCVCVYVLCVVCLTRPLLTVASHSNITLCTIVLVGLSI